MYALDFEYDKLHLSDFGFIVCDFNQATGADIVDVGADITFNTVSMQRGKIRRSTGAQYDKCLQTTIHICKNPDETSDMVISRDEYRDISRWLCREEYLPLRIIYADDFECETCYFDASFTVNRIEINKLLYGIELTIQTNRPFGYGIERREILRFTDNDLQKKMIDHNDVIGRIYPDMTIICKQDGDISIRNETLNCTTIIKHCVSGEVITIHGDEQIIESSIENHALYNDFNFQFLQIGNTYQNRKNTISANVPCVVEIRYKPTIFSAL